MTKELLKGQQINKFRLFRKKECKKNLKIRLVYNQMVVALFPPYLFYTKPLPTIKKKTFAIILMTFSLITSSQNIYEYEKEIGNREDYIFSEIDFQNKDENIKLSGTLITPKTEFDKIIIIVAGSGRDTRYAHFILAEEFLKNGIAVYRFDERGIGKSEGKFSPFATTLADDLSYAILELRNLELTKSYEIGVLGHSLGGIASIRAYEKRQNIDFLIQMGTPVEKYGAFFKYQTKNDISEFYRIKGKTQQQVIELLNLIYPIIIENEDNKTIRKKAKRTAKENGFKKDFYKFISPTHIDHVKQNHEKTYQNIKISKYQFYTLLAKKINL